ncbi:hypothetical protein A5715_06445 [Mycolicibacter heraklionensis]|nr:hypothetical protein A5715_06445 [Mycolicibacter heraklionensis]
MASLAGADVNEDWVDIAEKLAFYYGNALTIPQVYQYLSELTGVAATEASETLIANNDGHGFSLTDINRLAELDVVSFFFRVPSVDVARYLYSEYYAADYDVLLKLLPLYDPTYTDTDAARYAIVSRAYEIGLDPYQISIIDDLFLAERAAAVAYETGESSDFNSVLSDVVNDYHSGDIMQANLFVSPRDFADPDSYAYYMTSGALGLAYAAALNVNESSITAHGLGAGMAVLGSYETFHDLAGHWQGMLDGDIVEFGHTIIEGPELFFNALSVVAPGPVGLLAVGASTVLGALDDALGLFELFG